MEISADKGNLTVLPQLSKALGQEILIRLEDHVSTIIKRSTKMLVRPKLFIPKNSVGVFLQHSKSVQRQGSSYCLCIITMIF